MEIYLYGYQIFLQTVFQRVVADDCLSDWIDIKSGVPQAGADLGFPKGSAKLGALSKRSWSMPSQEFFCKFSFLGLNLAIILTEPYQISNREPL